MICATILVVGKHTRQDQRLPCPRAANRCIFALSVPQASPPLRVAAPACDLERRAEDLGAYKFSHGGGCSGGVCDWRGWECVWRGGVGGGGGRSAVGQQEVCDLGSARDWFGGQDRSRRRTAATRTRRHVRGCSDCSALFLSVVLGLEMLLGGQ
jgi:hypothetical protein